MNFSFKTGPSPADLLPGINRGKGLEHPGHVRNEPLWAITHVNNPFQIIQYTMINHVFVWTDALGEFKCHILVCVCVCKFEYREL